MAERAHIVMPCTYWNTSHRKACTNMFQYWPSYGRETDIFCHQATRDLKRQWPGTIRAVTPTLLPDGLVASLDRRVSAEWFHKRLVSRLSRIVRPGDLAVAWPGTPIETIRALKGLGAVVAIEFINTHCQHSYRILEAEHRKLGLTYKGKISPERIEKDDLRIEEADIIFCPNRFVEESILDARPVRAKIIASSRGTFLRQGQAPRKAPTDVFTFVFVGEFGVRKGAPYIVEAMKKIGPSARLLVAGQMGAEMTEWMAGRDFPDNIELLGFVRDIAKVYAEGDALLFPSLEEGGPKVCYEAAAHALPLIVSEMGGGRIAKDGETGYVVPGSDAEALAGAMRRLATERRTYEAFSGHVLEKVKDFSWEAISRDRHEKLLQRGL